MEFVWSWKKFSFLKFGKKNKNIANGEWEQSHGRGCVDDWFELAFG